MGRHIWQSHGVFGYCLYQGQKVDRLDRLQNRLPPPGCGAVAAFLAKFDEDSLASQKGLRMEWWKDVPI